MAMTAKALSVERCRNRRLDMKREYLRCHPCVECGEDDFRCLDMHHRDPAKKHPALKKTSSWRIVPFRDMEAEFAKCDVLCANCHRKEHYGG